MIDYFEGLSNFLGDKKGVIANTRVFYVGREFFRGDALCILHLGLL